MVLDPEATAASVAPPVARPTAHWVVQVLLVAACAGVSQGFARFTFAFVLPQMTEDVLGSYSVAGLLGAVNLGSYLMGLLVVTSIGRRIESTRLLKIGLVLTCLGLLIVGLAPGLPLLVVGMAVLGGCSAAVWIPSAGIVAARAPDRHRGVAFGITTAGIGLSITAIGVITMVVHSIAGPDSWRPVWLVEAALGGLILFAQLGWLQRTERAAAAARERVRHLVHGFYRLMTSYFLYGASYSLFVSYLIAALEDAGLTSGEASRAYAFLGLASMAGGLVLGRLSDRISRRGVLAGGIIGTGSLCLFVPLGLTGLAIPVALAYGLLMTGIGSVVVAYVSDTVAMSQVSAAFGTITMSLGVSQWLAPPIGGWLIDFTGSFTWTYVVAAATGLAGGVIALTLPPARPDQVTR